MDAGHFEAFALVDRCRSPDQFECGFSDDEKKNSLSAKGGCA